MIEGSYKIYRIAPEVSRSPLTAINRDHKILADKFTDRLFAFERQLNTENKGLKYGSDSSDHKLIIAVNNLPGVVYKLS